MNRRSLFQRILGAIVGTKAAVELPPVLESRTRWIRDVGMDRDGIMTMPPGVPRAAVSSITDADLAAALAKLRRDMEITLLGSSDEPLSEHAQKRKMADMRRWISTSEAA